MISSIQVSGYRGFEHFEMKGLGRANLLVGVNNGGKTSVLEAIHRFSTNGDPSALWQTLWRRAHLFYGHELQSGSCFRVTASGGVWDRRLDIAGLAGSQIYFCCTFRRVVHEALRPLVLLP